MRISDWSSDVCSSDLHFGIERLRQVHAVDLVPAPLILLILAVTEACFPVPAVRNLAAQARPTADRLALVLGDLAADFVEAATPGDARAGGRRFVDRKSTRLNSSH